MTDNDASPEQKKNIDRNTALRQLIADGKIPVLPFEVDSLHGTMRQHIADQARLGKLLGEAMEQSSETFHDNAPADAIEDEAYILVSRVGGTKQAIRGAVEFSYPDEVSTAVTLGSIVEISYDGDDDDRETVYMTGYVREVDFLELGLPEHVEVVTLSSPLGSSLLGLKEGDEAVYTVQGRIQRVHAHTIVQHTPLEQAGYSQ